MPPLKKDLSFDSGESIDLSRNDSPDWRNYSLEGIPGGENSWRRSNAGAQERSPSVCSSIVNMRTTRTDSVVEELLSDIYDGRWQVHHLQKTPWQGW